MGVTMNFIRENDFVENFADSDDEDDDTETEILGEEEELNACKNHIRVIFNLYKESKNEDIIELGEKWQDHQKKCIEVLEKRSNLIRLICDFRSSLKRKNEELSKLKTSDSSDKKE